MLAAEADNRAIAGIDLHWTSCGPVSVKRIHCIARRGPAVRQNRFGQGILEHCAFRAPHEQALVRDGQRQASDGFVMEDACGFQQQGVDRADGIQA